MIIKKIVFLILPFLFVTPVYAEYIYNREPLGQIIHTPVNITISFTEENIPTTPNPVLSWKIFLSSDFFYFSDRYNLVGSIWSDEYSFTNIFPQIDYVYGVVYFSDLNCETIETMDTLSGLDPFEIIGNAIINLPNNTTNDLLAYVGRLFTDTWVLIALAVGMPLGFYVIKRAINIVKK